MIFFIISYFLVKSGCFYDSTFYSYNFSCKTTTWSHKRKICISCHHNFSSELHQILSFFPHHAVLILQINWWSLDSTWWYYILVIMFGLFLVTSWLRFWNLHLCFSQFLTFLLSSNTILPTWQLCCEMICSSSRWARPQSVHVNRRVIPQRKPDVGYRSRATTFPGVKDVTSLVKKKPGNILLSSSVVSLEGGRWKHPSGSERAVCWSAAQLGLSCSKSRENCCNNSKIASLHRAQSLFFFLKICVCVSADKVLR